MHDEIIKIKQPNGKVFFITLLEEKEDRVVGYPYGGGFTVSYPLAWIAERNVKSVDQPYEQAIVVLEGLEQYSFVAYLNDLSYWNGWAVPKLDAYELNKFVTIMNRLYDDKVSTIRYRPVGNQLLMFDDNEPDIAWTEQSVRETIICDNMEVKVWNCGLGLCWRKVT